MSEHTKEEGDTKQETQTETQPQTETPSETTLNHSGRIKWFNNNAGYGFIRVNDGTDVFVHHTGIVVEEDQYKYLVQGEYVSLTLEPMNDGGSHKYQAVNVRGVNGAKLMCEVRRRDSKPKTDDKLSAPPPASQPVVKSPKSSKTPSTSKPVVSKQPKQEVQVVTDASGNVWTLMKQGRSKKA